MKYKVGDELILKVKIAELDSDSYPYKVEFGNEGYMWLSEEMISSSRIGSSEHRRKEIQEQIKALNEELENLK